jgi:hypothetical protein
MTSRSRYKRRVVSRGRVKGNVARANTSPSLSKTINDQGRKLPTKSVSNKARDRQKLIDRLGRRKPMVRMTVAGLVVGIASIVIGLYFGFWPRSPEPVIGKPIPTTTGGRNPVPLFNDQSCANVQGTELVLYSLNNVLNCGSLMQGAVMHLGISQPESYCASSYVMPRQGVYRCAVQVNGMDTIADPCFGVDKGQVECELPDGLFGLLNVITVISSKPYQPSLSEVGRQYPFRLELDNGMTCTWNWLHFMGHTGGGWICAIPLAEIELRPVHNHQFLFGRDALNYNGALVAGTNNIYYAEDLVQGSQSTWSVLLEGPNNPGVFQRVSVTQAWY